MTALLAASDAGNAEIAGLLVKAGADVEAQTDVGCCLCVVTISYMVQSIRRFLICHACSYK